MQKQINQITLKIAYNLLYDQINNKTLDLILIHQKFAKDFTSKNQKDIYQWLIKQIKNINFTINNIIQGTKNYFEEIQLYFIFQFFHKCCKIMQQNNKYLIQALIQNINKKIDISKSPLIINNLTPKIIIATNQQQTHQQTQQKIKRYSKQINRDLQSLDYFLNLLTYQDNKTYQQYKSQCDKILLQRELLQKIQPSHASRQIMQATNIIQNVMQHSDKIFQDSYMLKYMQFKSFMGDLNKPQEFNNLFKQQLSKQTKSKFIQGMTRTFKKCYEIHRKQNEKNRINIQIQTQQIKGIKYQQKLQNLLIIQKKNNQKLISQINLLKKRKSNDQNYIQLQKNIQKYQIKQKQMYNKYKILQNLYNKKCQEYDQSHHQTIIIQPHNSKKHIEATHISIQTQNLSNNILIQTDLDFYYYFQSKKIYDYKSKIIQLQQIIKHKQYIIQEMEAIRTFRDNFKEKKQVYSTVIRRQRKFQKAKSLHYLDQSDQIYDLRNEQKNGKSSIEANTTKKKVTLQQFDQQNSSKNFIFSISKKNKKKTQIFRNKPYFELNAKVQNEPQQIPKSESQLQKISLKSILKLGSNHFKKQFAVQTDPIKFQYYDNPIQQDGKSKIERIKLNSRQKLDRSQKLLISKIRPNESSSLFKKKNQNYEEQQSGFRKSNFVVLEQQIKQKNNQSSQNNSTLRLSGFTNPKIFFMDKTKNINLTRTSKWNQNKVNTTGNQILHVNNSLNFNFLAPINSPKQSIISSDKNKNKSKYQNIKKIKKNKIL